MPERVYRRRRRVAAGLIVAGASAGLIVLELAVSDPFTLDPGPGAPVVETPEECAGGSAASLRRGLGRRLLVRMESEANASLRRQASRGEIGGVILFPDPGTDPRTLEGEIAELQEAATKAGEPPLVVAIDQEGGEVKRLPQLPPRQAPPEIAHRGPDAAREQGLATGRALAGLGINVDLAPVLDVPASPDSFVASRSFGSEPAEVAENGVAFASGLAEGGVAATAKHFPGLGRSAVNTDLEPSVVDASAAALHADLLPFERFIDTRGALVMLANAAYPALGAKRPAFASPPVAIDLLRDELGFAGITITDDLDAGAVRSEFDRAAAARAAIAGGADLLLFAQIAEPDVLEALVGDAERGRFDASRLEESCVRVSSLRASLREPGT